MNNLLLVLGIFFVIFLFMSSSQFSDSNRKIIVIRDYSRRIEELEAEIDKINNSCSCQGLGCTKKNIPITDLATGDDINKEIEGFTTYGVSILR